MENFLLEKNPTHITRKMEVEPTQICRFCLTEGHYFKNISETDYEILNTLLPTMELTLTTEPVVCKACSEIMQKYLAFKTISSDIKNLQEVKVMCLFCMKSITLDTFVCLNSKEMLFEDVLLLRTMIEQCFPELDFHINMDLFNICSVCDKNIYTIFNFLMNLQSIEQCIEKYNKTVGVVIKGKIDLKHVICYTKEEEEVGKEIHSDSGIIKLESDQFIKQESTEEDVACYIKVERDGIITPVDYIPTETLNETDKLTDQKVKLECEATGTDTNMNDDSENLKIEPLWLEEENIDIKSPINDYMGGTVNDEDYTILNDNTANFSSSQDYIQDSIESVVTRWANYKPIDQTEPTKGEETEEKPSERFVKETKRDL